MSSEITSPLGAKILAVHAKEGDPVAERFEVVTIEAMKMEMPVYPAKDGVISSIKVKVNDIVEQGQVLFVLD